MKVERSVKDFVNCLYDAQKAYEAAYAEALKPGPHNPEGDPRRAEVLARAYIAGYIRTFPNAR